MVAVRVVAAPDKFRGTATAAQVAAAIGRAAAVAGWECGQVPMADGGEGTLAALGGPNRTSEVTGPLGVPVLAAWRLDGRLAVIEMAYAAGLDLVGGAEHNDPIAASTIGVGELIGVAMDNGARRVIVGLGGSATTDGGLAALRGLYPLARLKGVELIAACDALVGFYDAAERFAPQKGASPAQVAWLRRRLERLAQVYLDEHGVDVVAMPGAGAGGGLGGGLAAVGATLVSGFDLVADEVDLDEHIEGADLVITGEGFLDAGSFDGKVVGGVEAMAARFDVPVVAIAGRVYDGMANRLESRSLVDGFGEARALGETLACIEEAALDLLVGFPRR